MSENKRYYWLKLKKDFFDGKMIKILRTFEKGDKLILIFLKLELFSLENDGYIYYEHMLPTFEQELSVAIDEDASLVKEAFGVLLRFGAIKKVDENKYYISALEDCIGSETNAAQRMRKKRQNSELTNEQCSLSGEHCSPEIEIEIEKEKEKDIEKELYQEKKRGASSFPAEKKRGGYKTQRNYYSKNNGERFNKYADIEDEINSQELVYVPVSERKKLTQEE